MENDYDTVPLTIGEIPNHNPAGYAVVDPVGPYPVADGDGPYTTANAWHTNTFADGGGYDVAAQTPPDYIYRGALTAPCPTNDIEHGYAGCECGVLKHYFECRHAKVCNCGKVSMAPAVDEGQ